MASYKTATFDDTEAGRAIRAEYQRRYKSRDPERFRARGRSYYLQTKYGIGAKEYDALYAAQNGCCAICRKHQSTLKQPLHVDHCHVTEKVRGLLCKRCNLGIGMLEESADSLTNAIDYLEHHSGRKVG
jgi:hypothetical protein